METNKIVKGIIENVELHRSLDSYKKAPAEERLAYLESTLSALWAATHTQSK